MRAIVAPPAKAERYRTSKPWLSVDAQTYCTAANPRLAAPCTAAPNYIQYGLKRTARRDQCRALTVPLYQLESWHAEPGDDDRYANLRPETYSGRDSRSDLSVLDALTAS